MTKAPYSGSRFTKYLNRRILELRPTKSQGEIAGQAGFPNPNMIAILKSGRSKLALDRVPAMARALECDPAMLFRMVVEQGGNEALDTAIAEIFGTIVSRNEVVWLQALREASDDTDPALTKRARKVMAGIFGK